MISFPVPCALLGGIQTSMQVSPSPRRPSDSIVSLLQAGQQLSGKARVERGPFPAELAQKTTRRRRAGRRERDVKARFVGNGGRAWESTFHFRERGGPLASAALRIRFLQVLGEGGPQLGVSAQVETIRGIIWAESSWRRPGGLCSMGGGPIGVIAPNLCCFLTRQ